jgi:hypothetical protein
MTQTVKCLLILSLLFISDSLEAIPVTGRVTNSNNEPLPFANVYIRGTTNGTTTNIDGYYRLDVPAGHHDLVFRFIGYRMRVEPVFVSNAPLEVNVALEREQYTLSEVKVQADAEDPAYPIIRNAIDMRKYYLNQVDEFSCDVYIKGLQRLTKYPSTFFGMEINLGEFIDTLTGIVYLSESVSEYHFKKPDQVKEVMISSKVSGSNRAFSFNQASDMEFDFYENILMVGELSQRGFISPISASALFYYRYRLDGSFLESGRWVYRIEVIPKRKNDPVFSGYIFIQDSTWRIHSTELMLTRDSQIEFVDTLQVNQSYIPVDKEEDVWMIGSSTFYFAFSAFGFEGNGNYVGVFSDYKIKPSFEKKFFKGSVMKVNDDSNKKDEVYWETIRPIPLTPEETLDYYKRDSLMVIKESEPYLDSLDRISNRFKPGKLLTGYIYTNRYSKTQYQISSLLETIQFNTVEGLNIGSGLRIEKRFERRNSFVADGKIRYGFSNEKISASGLVQYNYNTKKFSSVTLSGGDDLVQYNAHEPISPIINTSYSLFDEKNYMKLFQKQYGKVSWRNEPVNGLRVSFSAELAQRKAVQNTTDYTFKSERKDSYTSNNPLNPGSDVPAFGTHQAFKVHGQLRVRFKQKYIDRPNGNWIIGSKYPTLILAYNKGLNGIAGSDVDYDHVEVGVEDRIRLGMAGTLNYYVVYGYFLRKNKMYFMDFQHFDGNRTIFSGFQPRRFDLLPYYDFSTKDEYVQLFAEHEFGGLIFNKIPGVRRLKLNEIAGFRFLHIPGVFDYYEASFGLEKLGFIRADFVMSFDGSGKSSTGFVIGIKRQIGL